MTLPRWLYWKPEQSNAAWVGAGTTTERTAYPSAVDMNFWKGGLYNAQIIKTPAGRMGVLPAPENRPPHLQSPLPQLRKQLQAELSGWGAGVSQVLIQTLCLLRSKKQMQKGQITHLFHSKTSGVCSEGSFTFVNFTKRTEEKNAQTRTKSIPKKEGSSWTITLIKMTPNRLPFTVCRRRCSQRKNTSHSPPIPKCCMDYCWIGWACP